MAKKSTVKTASKTVAGHGPKDGAYTLAWTADLKKETVWHFRKAGQTVCGAHNGAATALRTNATYVVAAKPKGEMCNVCAAAMAASVVKKTRAAKVEKPVTQEPELSVAGDVAPEQEQGELLENVG